MTRLRCGAFLLVGLLGACNEVSPDTRTGMWSPTGANDRNIAAMAAPRDLIRGHGDRRGGGTLAAEAVTRLQAGRPKPLPSLSAQAAPGADAAGPTPGAPAAPAATPAPAATAE